MKKINNNYYYDSSRQRNSFFHELRALIQYRELLQILIINNIKTRYKRSSLGVLWTMLNPLLYMTVMVIAFSELFRFQINNYPVYLLSGLIAWNFFSQTTTQAIQSLVWGGGTLLKRVYLPKTIFSVAAVGAGIINLLLACIPLFFIMLFTHQPIYLSWWFLPIAILILAAVALGVALLVSIISVFFNDIVELYQILLQALFYLTPIMYPDNILPAKIQSYLLLNPLYDVIKVFRTAIYEGHLPSMSILLSAVIVASAVLCLGWWCFTRKADQIVYWI